MHVMQPNWQVPASVKSVITTRVGGVSSAPYDSLNLAMHVGDDEAVVKENRQILQKHLLEELSSNPEIQWLTQVHSTTLRRLNEIVDLPPCADAAYTNKNLTACAVLTADCLPVLVCDELGTEVAAIHAGWRGLAAGILTKSICAFNASPENLMCFLGPAISQAAFQVGQEVFDVFKQASEDRFYLQPVEAAFAEDGAQKGRFFCDLFALARSELQGLGINKIEGGEHCTFGQPEQFYSFRRQTPTGRIASLIWLDQASGH